MSILTAANGIGIGIESCGFGGIGGFENFGLGNGHRVSTNSICLGFYEQMAQPHLHRHTTNRLILI